MQAHTPSHISLVQSLPILAGRLLPNGREQSEVDSSLPLDLPIEKRVLGSVLQGAEQKPLL